MTQASPAPLLAPVSEPFWSIVIRRSRYLVAILISGWLFLLLSWHLIQPPPEMAGVSLLLWPSAVGPFAPIALTLILLLVTALCTLLVHPDNPHMGLACALLGSAALSIRGGSVHMLIQNAKNAHAYPAVSKLLAYESIEWAIIFLFAEFFARFLHDRFFANPRWLTRAGADVGPTTASGLASSNLAVGISLAFSKSIRTHQLPRSLATPLAIIYSSLGSLLLLYIFMQSPLKGQVLFACLIAFFLSTLNAYLAFPKVPALWFFLAVPLTAAIAYFLWQNSPGVYPGLGGSFISHALPIDFFSMGIPGAILGYYAALHWSLATEDQPLNH